MQERLQKILARAGLASRRGAEQLMEAGRVTVNGTPVRELGTKADLAHDDIRVDGVRVKAPGARVYIVLNKPRGVVTTRRDPAGRQTVMDLVPGVAGLFPVGRLDVTTEGLILLTNDGAFAERVAHPRYEVPRVYHAKVHRTPDARTLERLQRGVTVEGDRLKADRVRVIGGGNNPWLELTLHEGKQHEVRRLLEAVGHPVSKLRRVAIGPVLAKGLDVGQYRALRTGEVAGLLRGEGAPAVLASPPRGTRPAPRGRGSSTRPPGKGWSRDRRPSPGERTWGRRGPRRGGRDRAGGPARGEGRRGKQKGTTRGGGGQGLDRGLGGGRASRGSGHGGAGSRTSGGARGRRR